MSSRNAIIRAKRYSISQHVHEVMLANAISFVNTQMTQQTKDIEFIEQPVGIREFVESKSHMDFPPLSERQYQVFEFMIGDDPQAAFSNGNSLAVLAWGKGTLLGHEEIITADGARMTMQECAERKLPTQLWSKTESGRITTQISTPAIKKPHQENCFKVKTSFGHISDASEDHKYFTINGWKKLKDLKVGDWICAAQTIPVTPRYNETPALCRWIGYMIGDGCISGADNTPTFFAAKPDIITDYCRVVETFGYTPTVRVHNTPISRAIRYTCGGKGNGLIVHAKRLDIYGHKSDTKRIPVEIMFSPIASRIAFLEALYATDGWYSSHGKSCWEIGYASKNRKLVEDLDFMLRSFGIVGKIRPKYTVYKGERREYWQHIICHKQMQRKFIDTFHVLGKQDTESRMRASIFSGTVKGFDCPPEPTRLATPLVACMPGRIGATSRGNIKSGQIFSYDRVQQLCASPELANSDIIWERIDSIEPLGFHDVYTFTVPLTHNYLQGGLFHHNSGKDTLCVLILCYVCYLCLCMKSPQAYFKQPEGECLDCVNIAPSGAKANEVFFEKLRQRILRWRWLKDKYPVRNSGAFISQIKPDAGEDYVTITKDGILFPKLIRLLSKNSDNESAEGLNTLVYVLDEACFEYHQPIMLADGSKKYISDIVDNRLPLDVLSYNFDTGKVEPKRVVNWYKYKASGRPMVKVKLNESKFKYAKVLTGTTNHHIFTPHGVTTLGELRAGDLVYCRGVFMSKHQREVLLGSLLGDASITAHYNLQFTHGQAQLDYLKFKEDMFAGFFIKRRETASGYAPENKVYQSLFRVCEDTQALRTLCYSRRLKRKYISAPWAKQLTLTSLAYFFLDDGSLGGQYYNSHEVRKRTKIANFSCYSFSTVEVRRLAAAFKRIGYPVRMFKDKRYVGQDRGYVLWMNHTVTCRFLSAIRHLVPPAMSYKLGDTVGTATPEDSHTTVKLLPVVSTQPYTKSVSSVYDIEVEDNHNYFASDILVSNSAFQNQGKQRNAAKIYRNVKSSSTTRFGLRGKGFIISYPREIEDFTMTMYKENLGNLHVYTDKAATWEIKPLHLFSGQWFTFTDGYTDQIIDGKLVKIPNEIQIPLEFKEQFDKDPTAGKMMLMADPPESEHGFIEYPEKVAECIGVNHRPVANVEDFVRDGKICKRITSFTSNIVSPHDHIITIDLGRSSDSAALGMYHREMVGKIPVFVQDLITGWVPDRRHKYMVSFINVREFIQALAARFNIIGVWFDQWQSASLQEELNASAIPSFEYNLDLSDYKTFKEMIYTKRYKLLAFVPQLVEIKQLISMGYRVDHPSTGSKDYVDTIVGATKVWMLKHKSTGEDEAWGEVETIEENLTMQDPWA